MTWGCWPMKYPQRYMSATQRFQLLEWASQAGAWIIEDDYDSEYRYNIMPIGSLQWLDTRDRGIYIGTFSKVLFLSLRVGYVVIPPGISDITPDYCHFEQAFSDDGGIARR